MNDLEISIKERELNMELLKKQLEESGNNPEKIDIEKAAALLGSHKVEKHKSNFYKNLTEYQKVTKISTTLLTPENKQIREPFTVDRTDFIKYVLTSSELPAVLDDNASIQIISPVLKEENYKWKGLYRNAPIDFYMKDKAFKNSVIAEGVPFKNGTSIDCVLEIKRKIDDTGEIYSSSYSVIVVILKHDEHVTVELPQGIKYMKDKREMSGQLNLFDTNQEE